MIVGFSLWGETSPFEDFEEYVLIVTCITMFVYIYIFHKRADMATLCPANVFNRDPLEVPIG